MRKGKIARLLIGSVIAGILVFAAWYCWNAFPAVSGYGAKNLCSAVYLQHRKPADVIKEEFSDFPLSLGSFTVNEADSTVTGSVWGMAKRKAIFRKSAGATLVNDFNESAIRSQRFDRPVPSIHADTILWPLGDKLPTVISPLVDKPALDRVLDSAIVETKNGKPVHTRAVLVLYDGQIVGEKYAPGYSSETVMLGWSMSKSLTAAMIGILVKDGKLDVNAPAPVPEWKGTKKESITLKQLLQQTTGLDFKEVYTFPSEVTNMLFSQGDMAAFTAKRPLKDEPGTVFNYSSGNSNILSRIIRHTVGETAYPAFPYEALFYKIGMYSALLEPDASGTYIGSSYSYATARDFARFGLLYYNQGRWNGEQVLPADWVQQSTKPVQADKQKHYGYQFWLNGLDAKDMTRRIFPDVPADMYYADGYGGQDVYIIPSKKLIVVRLGLHVIDENKLLKEIIQCTGE